MEQVEEHQSVNNEEAENSVLDNQQEGGSTVDRAYIDVEAITVREDVIKDVVDLTKDNTTSFVDLTKEDTPRQPLRRGRVRSRRQQKSSHPYGQRQSTSHDTSIEIVPESSALSQSVESSPEQNSGKKICCPVCMDDSDRINRGTRQLVSTTCGHIFCNVCLQEAVRIQRKCPTCRRKLNVKQYHPIFI